MVGFVGRERELRSLRAALGRVEADGRGRGPGRCILVRGRRRVGKSRLVEELCETAGVPYVFFTASRQGEREPRLFAEEVLASTLPQRELFDGVAVDSWDAALRLLANAVGDEPAIVVVDEFPYLAEHDDTVEATFQKQWDRLLSKKPVLLVMVGSDLAMMESLDTHGRAFFQRGTPLVLGPLNPAECGELTRATSAADAFDAHLITGGLPLICDEWPGGMPLWGYLEWALHEPTSALIVSGERSVQGEFPTETQARHVLGQVGSGEVTFSNIARAAGGMQAATLTRALKVLAHKRVIARDLPLATVKSREARYRVADPYLRFWLRFIAPGLAEIERGRGDRVLERIRASWTTWRGRAIEPVIREALSRLSPVPDLDGASAVGSYWTRTNNPEIDLIGADKAPVAGRITYAGTIKWLDNAPLAQRDINKLAADVDKVPGADENTPLVAVARAGVTASSMAASLGPDDLIEAWKPAT